MVDAFNPMHFKVVDTAVVDDELWYQVRVFSTPCRTAVRSHKQSLWYEHSQYYPLKGTLFDIHEKLFTILAIEFSSS